MPTRLAFLPIACALLFGGGAARAGENRLAPIPRSEAVSTHGPFEMGACETCHERRDPRNPGAALKVSNDLCFGCHEEFKGTEPVRMEKAVHPSTVGACTGCHNPHNSRKKKLRL